MKHIKLWEAYTGESTKTPIGRVDGFDLVYETYSKMMGGDGVNGTIRTIPQNYYVASITADGDIIKANNGITAIGAATTEATVIANLKIALNAVPVVYADEPASEAISAEALPEGVAPLPDFVPRKKKFSKSCSRPAAWS